MQFWISHFLDKKNSARNFLIVFLAQCFCYRINFLVMSLHQHHMRKVRKQAFSNVALGSLDDLCVVIALIGLIALTQFIFKKKLASPLFQRIGKLVLCLLLVIISFDLFANIKVFFTLYTPGSFSLLHSALQQGFTLENFIYFMDYQDWFFLIMPVCLFLWLEQGANYQTTLYLSRGMVTLCVVSVALGIFTFRYSDIVFFKQMYQNPIIYVFDNLYNPNKDFYATRLEKPGDKQMHSLRLIDPVFVNATQTVSAPLRQPKKDWNIIIFVLESVGSPFIFDSPDPAIVPMPFLKKLSSQSLWLNNNYTAGNTTLKGAFGILSGIYPSVLPDNFEMGKNIHTPCILNWLDKKYDSMYVMAADINYFFNKEMILHSGFKHIYDFYDISKVAPGHTWYDKPNELEAVNFFMRHLTTLSTPFLAIYWSNATHSPYRDYGPSERIFSEISDDSNRYYNNLRLVDKQLKRLFDFLAATQLLKNTIVVIVGDHGEGFGRYPDDWFHGMTVYQDQVRVPLLIYQPALFKPRTVNTPTSSTDILPTLLTALGVNYDSALLQGEDLVNASARRKYIFTYGNEDELASIDQHNSKVKVNFIDGTCLRYDLNKDVFENHPQPCRHDAQEDAIIKFRNFQPVVLKRYNKLLENHCQWLAQDKTSKRCVVDDLLEKT